MIEIRFPRPSASLQELMPEWTPELAASAVGRPLIDRVGGDRVLGTIRHAHVESDGSLLVRVDVNAAVEVGLLPELRIDGASITAPPFGPTLDTPSVPIGQPLPMPELPTPDPVEDALLRLVHAYGEMYEGEWGDLDYKLDIGADGFDALRNALAVLGMTYADAIRRVTPTPSGE